MTDSGFEEKINAYFVNVGGVSNGMVSASDADFENALKLLRKHIPDIPIRQIQSSEGFSLIAAGQLTKKDVFVFNRFDGDFFKQLQQTKALLIGARCLTTCLLDRQAIPLGTSPVYTTAMRNLHISATGITPKEKARVRELIQWMGGYYFPDFGRCVTHLLSNTIRSNKYEQATLHGIPIMHVDWVQRLWERSCVDDVNATDKEFEKYTLPIFFGTNITCSGLATDKKNEISQLVNANGGTYHSCFRSQVVDIVITEKNKTGSDKYKAAVRFKKDILLPEWIFDSVKKGFALPMKNYEVKSLNASTPTKSQQSVADFTATNTTHLSDISRISAVGAVRSNLMSSINETVCSNVSDKDQTFVPPARPLSSAKDLQREVLKKSTSNYRLVLDEIDPKIARSAGTFLDGCCIYLSGFRLEEREKLNRILNVGGATRYDVVNEKITHIIVGTFNDTEYRSWKKDGILTGAHIVSLSWLLESIKIKQPASEVVYRMPLPATQAPETPSPSSKRTLRSMNHSFKQPDKPIKKKLFDNNENDVSQGHIPISGDTTITEQPCVNALVDEDEQSLIAQYSQEHLAPMSGAVPLPPKRSTVMNESHTSDNMTLHAPPMASSTQCAPNASTLMSAAVEVAPVLPPVNETEMADTIDYEHLNFLQGVTVYIFQSHFRDEFYSQIVYECEAAKGDMVSSSFRDKIDYAIVSFERTLDPSILPVKAKHIVNDLYVETCLKQNKFTAIEYYHKHIPHTADTLPLKGMTIVVSTYSGLERDFVDSIAELLGARVNKTFMKKEKPLLVCPLPEGSKYQGAIKWGYPVVTSKWLLDCAEHGVKLSYQPYLVGESVADFPISPTLRERNSDSSERTQRINMQQDNFFQHMDIDENPITPVENRINVRDSQTPCTSKQAAAAALANNCTPLRNRRVSELAGPARSAQTHNTSSNTPGTSSPHTPTNHLVGPTYNIEIMEAMLSEIDDVGQRECWREIINEIRKNPTPQLERIRRQACTPNNRGKWPSPKGIPEFCTTPAYKQRMRDEFERRYRLPIKEIPPDTPIEEICKRVLYATCKSQGIPIGSDEEEDQQHKQQKQQSVKKANADIRSVNSTPLQRTNATKGSPTFAAPRTLFESQNVTPHNNSRPYVPDTQTPNSSKELANLSISGIGQRASIMGKSTIDFDKISFEDTELAPAKATTSRPSTSSNTSNASVSPEVKQITDYLKSFETRRQSLKRSAAQGGEPPHQMSRGNIAETEGHFVQLFESEQLVGTEEMVGWQDPAQFSAVRLAKMVPQMQHKGTPRFSISCTDDETKQNIIVKIQKLGGEVCENLANFDESCTHYLCERPNRGEKILGCISSGKWVLSLRYIEESYAKNTFVDEELFEWGNCKALNLPQLNSDEQLIALAAHRWRRELFATKGGAFTGIHAILRLAERNLNALKTVIKAGKGEIIEAQSPYNRQNQAHLATHCFVDMKRNPLTREDYNFLKENNVKVLTQMYINQYLMSGRDVNYTQYEVQL